MPTDAAMIQQADKILRGKPGERRFGKMAVLRNEILRLRMKIGKVAAPSAGYSDFLTSAFGMIDQHHAPTASAGTEKPCRTRTNDKGVHLHVGLPFAVNVLDREARAATA